jgi:hypothetical protein
MNARIMRVLVFTVAAAMAAGAEGWVVRMADIEAAVVHLEDVDVEGHA